MIRFTKYLKENDTTVVQRTPKEPTVTMNIPFLIRALEHAREDIKDDVSLHKFVEKVLESGNDGHTLDMDCYGKIVKTENK